MFHPTALNCVMDRLDGMIQQGTKQRLQSGQYDASDKLEDTNANPARLSRVINTQPSIPMTTSSRNNP